MKLIILILLFFWGLQLKAGEGIVIVHETPLFKNPSPTSKIVQYARQGDKIFIHGRNFTNTIHTILLDDLDSFEENSYEGTELNRPDFYETVDKNGKQAYIPRIYVKLIYRDNREQKTPLPRFIYDPTDYRLPEPLPKNYPLYNPNRYRGGFNITISPPEKSTYNYPTSITQTSHNLKNGINFYFLKNLMNHSSNRLYIGFELQIKKSSSKIILKEIYRRSNEQKYIFSLGPYLTYDAFRNNKYRILVLSGLLLNYHLYNIYQSSNDYEEMLSFHGYSITPQFGGIFQKNFTKYLFWNLGATINSTIPYKLLSKDLPQYPEFWQDNNNYQHGY